MLCIKMHFATRRMCAAFSRPEALVVLVCVSVIGFRSLGDLAAGRSGSRHARCMANLAQVQRAWLLYALDNDGKMVGAYSNAILPDWAAGQVIHYTQPNTENWSDTPFPKQSPLWPYVGGQSDIFRCPSAPAMVVATDLGKPEAFRPLIRTISLNSWLGWEDRTWFNLVGKWRMLHSLDDFSILSPADTFSFIDEREDSIGDGLFVVRMEGENGNDSWQGQEAMMGDYPAYWHDRAASMAFADGHVGYRRWADPRTVTPRGAKAVYLQQPYNQPWNYDVRWMQLHSTTTSAP